MDEEKAQIGRLRDVSPELERILTTGAAFPQPFTADEIRFETIMMPMRDGVRLATDLYFPPKLPAPVVVMRTPYERAFPGRAATLMNLARAGYVAMAQDVRGVGDSEPDHWDWQIYEREDSFDCVEWIQAQDWCDGFIGSCGGSYIGRTQWEMARHPKMKTIVPEVSAIVGSASPSARFYMLLNAYSRTVGKGESKAAMSYQDMENLILEETLAGGYYNDSLDLPFPEPLLARFPELRPLSPSARRDWLWSHYWSLPPGERAEVIKLAFGADIVTWNDFEFLETIFGPQARRGRPSIFDPNAPQAARALTAPALVITGWYDFVTNHTIDSWSLIRRHADPAIASRTRLLIGPDAHNVPGYHEGKESHPELNRAFRSQNIADLLERWYATVRDGAFDAWPPVIYYLMGANEWHTALAWPPTNATAATFFIGENRVLTSTQPSVKSSSDRYTYDPNDPTPTLGGSIVSSIYPPGSVDVSEIQKRDDILAYTTAPLESDLDVVGPLKLILYASSSAVDTDFHARLTDVFPDGRAIQLQSGVLRARFRNLGGEAELLEPNRIYRLEIDMSSTANRFKAGHRLRVDISSADFPKFDRNSNRGGEPGAAIQATQTIYRDAEHPSQLIVSVLS